ncbi:SNF2 helicase associated domain-containing protein [Adlercreutzia equolifaciens]|uniref:DEAD/DEAH box helicase n=1 Tax=Adlercreutzia equolifaciens TaxID=446660 RepID=UPI0023AEFD5E|nr:SNF2-related protein [Adlercreutzia equolifaciens]MDE8703351.1 SNF2 helicase associated domain-containing protein [Adlercreutzia equolifaciens]
MTEEASSSRESARSSSPALAAFVRTLAQAPAEGDGAVRLVPTLTYGFGEFSVTFSVQGERGSYVVKSLDDFVAHCETGEEAAYGPKLSFVHSLGAFHRASRPLVGFVGRAVRRRREREEARGASRGRTFAYEERWSASRRTSETVGRTLHLSEDEVVDFLDATGEEPFAFACTDGSVRSRMTVHCASGRPPALLRLIEEDGGVVLTRDDALIGAFSGERAYVLFDDVFYRWGDEYAEGAQFIRQVYNSDDAELFVAAADLPAFGAAVLPRLEEAFEVQAPAFLDAYRRRPCQVNFYFDRVGEAIEVGARVCYGADEVVLSLGPSEVPEAVEQVREGIVVMAGVVNEVPEASAEMPWRNLEREQSALDLLQQYVPASASLPLADEEAMGLLLFEGLARFQEAGAVHTTPAFDRLLFARPPRLSLGLSLAGNLIAMDVALSDVPPEELAALLGSYRRHRRFHRLRQGAFLDLNAGDVAELNRLAQDMGLDAATWDGSSVELPTWQAFYLDNELADVYRDQGFTEFVDRYRALYRSAQRAGSSSGAAQGAVAAIPGFEAQLRSYQAAGVEWIEALWEAGLGGILADEMGLGKTVQVIAALCQRRAQAPAAQAPVPDDATKKPALVVCPASLVYNWTAEFARFAPALRVCAVSGTASERAVQRGGAAEVLVCSYDVVRRDAEAWEALDFDVVVLDEAQYVKNHATATTRAVKRLRADHRLALTGTPLENRLSELWSIFDFLMPGLLGPYQRFRERFEAAIIGGDEDAARRLRLLTAPFILRRTKRAVAPELPAKATVTVPVALEGEQRRLYDGAEQSLRERLAAQIRLSRSREARYLSDKEREARAPRVQVLAELSSLRRIALDPALVFENYQGSSAKMEALLELVSAGCEAGQKMLVYSQFTSFLARVAERLEQSGIPFYQLTGSTPKKERVALAAAFNHNKVPVFLISLKAGGVGLNLTGATVVVHTDPWWNDAAARQAADRTHRLGQDQPVTVYELVAQNTIEERMRSLAAMKAELAALVLGETEEEDAGDDQPGCAQGEDAGKNGLAAAGALSPEELYDLLNWHEE